ncbi:MAG: hypothetical protein JXQ23_10750 [Clostridia bacterium]|nr:hypothetical protein [Clostridia bacterium]
MEPSIENVKTIISYIPYFEDNNNDIAVVISMGKTSYIQYDENFEQFIHEVYQSQILMPNYVEYLAFYEKYQDDYIPLIESADFDTLRAILTGYIEQEKIHEGLWRRAYEEDIFLYLLKAFKKLYDAQK